MLFFSPLTWSQVQSYTINTSRHLWRLSFFFLRSILISLIIQLFKHPPFPSNYCIPSIRTPTFKIQYLNTFTLRSSNRVAEPLLAFDSLCGATTRVTEHLLTYYRCFWMSTRLLQLFPSSNHMCISLHNTSTHNVYHYTCGKWRLSIRIKYINQICSKVSHLVFSIFKQVWFILQVPHLEEIFYQMCDSF